MHAKGEIDAVLRVAAVDMPPAFNDGLKQGLRSGRVDRQMLMAIHCQQAGVGKLIEFREADATKLSLPADRGLIVCNPPYGERMLEQRSAQRLYSAFGRHLKYADGWKKYIISSEPEFEHYYGRQAVKKRKLYNGRLQCNVYMYY